MFGRKIRAISLLLVGVFLLSGALLSGTRGASAAESFQSAPVNPEFLEWQENVRQAEVERGVQVDFRGAE